MSSAPTPSDADLAPEPKAFGRTYWMLNSIEAFERLAYFGIRAVVPIYIMQATEPGGLHLTAVHKGIIYAWWAIFQSWLPMFTGGVADRYGYKRVLACAISTNIVGYLIMAACHSYYGFFAGIIVLAIGTAFFKPALQGSIAQNLNKANASMGWGLFYWVVNIGAVTAPLLATVILGKPHSAEGWRNLFLASAAYTSMNLLLLFTFKDVPSGADKTLSVFSVFWGTLENIWPYWFQGGKFDYGRGIPGLVVGAAGLAVLILRPIDSLGNWQIPSGILVLFAGLWFTLWLKGGKFVWQLRLPTFLLIMSCFWMMMYQVWDLHPNFIEDWIDSSSVVRFAGSWCPDSWQEYGDRGLIRVPQQILLTLNAFLIVLFVVPVSWLVRRMRTLSAMLIGMSVATGGTLVAGLTGSGWILLLGIVLFSLGEMLTGPKKNQYLGLIAPPGKKGLYLGYVNIPVGVGVGLGSLLAGYVYDNYGEKATLALKHLGTDATLVARAAQAADWSDSLERIPELTGIERNQAFAMAAEDLEQGPADAADTLRRAFRFDRGQIDNLALQYLATDPDNRETVMNGLAKVANKAADDLRGDTQKLSEQVGKLFAPGEDGSEPAGPLEATGDLAATTDILAGARELSTLSKLIRSLSSNGTHGATPGFAHIAHLLPDVLDVKRVVALEVLRERLNKDAEVAGIKGDAQIADMLWERFGDDPATLNNLALEYLAQNTPLIRNAVAELKFNDPVEQMGKKIGIGRTKSFAALSVARGASAAEVDDFLAKLELPGVVGADQRVCTYLAGLSHRRFLAVGQKDWDQDRALLRELIRTDEKALAVVLEGIDDVGLFDSIINGIVGLFGGGNETGDVTDEGVDYHRLAEKQDLIQKALDARDWSRSPELAARVMGLNIFEARAAAAAEINQSPKSTTRLLWKTYHPQYKVWIPFASIGVAAAIALLIFGQMAKKWADMNA